MAVTQPSLGGTTLPYPSAFSLERDYRGGFAELASGAVSIDLVTETVKHTFDLEWTAITTATLGDIQTAYAAIKSDTGTFVAPNGTTYTVTRSPTGGGLKATMVPGSSGNRWNVSLSLRQA